MVFSAPTFLFYFLPATIAVYVLAPVRARNPVLLAASLLFYVWGSGWLVVTLLISVVVDYVLGFPAERAAETGDRRLARRVITASVVVNLSLLGWFKYAGWLIGEAADLGLWTGAVPEITLPIGISFFTFQSMSYTIDVARGRCRHLANPLDFGLYVTLFPQLIAGPIVRFHELDEQIRRRSLSLELAGEGAIRFAHGLAKKVLIADTIAPVADAAFADPDSLTTPVAWLGIIAYTLQIYFDFSGYSDMAIGLGMIFGFRFPENFARPYSALSITDFWRRWHITLSNWFRDYVYIPLGGSRVASARVVHRNLLIVFFLTGLWHGADWTFVVWGLYHGAWLLVERATGRRHLDAPDLASATRRRVFTAMIVVVGWVFFRADSLTDAITYLGAMFGGAGTSLDALDPVLTTRVLATLALACGVFLLPRGWVTGRDLPAAERRVPRTARVAVMTLALPLSLLFVASGTFSPFLYFEF